MKIITTSGTIYLVDAVNKEIIGGPLERPAKFEKLVALIGRPMEVNLINGDKLVTSPVVRY